MVIFFLLDLIYFFLNNSYFYNTDYQQDRFMMGSDLINKVSGF